MQLQENQIFASRYMLVSRLGAGGFSEVWLANDMKTGLEVALKIYAPHGGMDDDGVKVFSSEYSGVFNMNHSNLLRPSYYDVEDNRPYLVMPYISNGSAKKYVGCMPESEVWKFVRDVANGLAYMHSLEPPMIHQDIKPDNVLIDSHGVYQITDFGISVKARSTLRKSAMAAGVKSGGTTAYMGPERFGKDPLPIKASDVWSLGATVYELMEGDAPFGDMGGLIQKSGAEIPNFKSDYSRELKDLVTACLAAETWDRPFASQLAEYAGEMIKGKKPVAPWTHVAAGHNDDGKAKKHGCITAFLVIVAIANAISLLCNGLAVAVFGTYAGLNIDTYMVSFVMNAINVVALIMLLKNVKAGFWAMCATCIVNLVMTCITDGGNMAYIVTYTFGAFVGIGIFALILRIRKNGVSGWAMLKPMNTLKKRFYVISAVILLACVVYAIIYSRNNVYLNVDESYVSFDADGGIETVQVDAGDDWEATEWESWIDVDEGYQLAINCERNPNTESRTGYVYVKCRDVMSSIEVTQNGYVYLKVNDGTSNVSKSFGAKGGRMKFDVSTNADSYETWGVPSWCSIENRTSSSFELVCETTNSKSSRDDYMEVRANGKSVRIDITQSGKKGASENTRQYVQSYIDLTMLLGYAGTDLEDGIIAKSIEQSPYEDKIIYSFKLEEITKDDMADGGREIYEIAMKNAMISVIKNEYDDEFLTRCKAENYMFEYKFYDINDNYLFHVIILPKDYK